jgi:hypothetical protein
MNKSVASGIDKAYRQSYNYTNKKTHKALIIISKNIIKRVVR